MLVALNTIRIRSSFKESPPPYIYRRLTLRPAPSSTRILYLARGIIVDDIVSRSDSFVRFTDGFPSPTAIGS